MKYIIHKGILKPAVGESWVEIVGIVFVALIGGFMLAYLYFNAQVVEVAATMLK